MSTVTPQLFAQALLNALGDPVSNPNVQNIVSWENAEGGNWSNSASYNPLNTSLQEPGSVNYQSGSPGGGVQAYQSWQQGLSATVSTLQEQPYTNILQALSNDAPYSTFQKAVTSSPWDGSSHYAGTAFGQSGSGQGSSVSLSANTQSASATSTPSPSGATASYDAAVTKAYNSTVSQQPSSGIGKFLVSLDGVLNPQVSLSSTIFSFGLDKVTATAEMIAARALFSFLSIGFISMGVFLMIKEPVGTALGITRTVQAQQRIGLQKRITTVAEQREARKQAESGFYIK